MKILPMNQDWKDILRDKFDDFEAEPSRDLWPAIEAGKPARPVFRSPLLWAAAACLLVLTGLAWWGLRPAGEGGPQPQLAQQQPAAVQGPSAAQTPPAAEQLQAATGEAAAPKNAWRRDTAGASGKMPLQENKPDLVHMPTHFASAPSIDATAEQQKRLLLEQLLNQLLSPSGSQDAAIAQHNPAAPFEMTPVQVNPHPVMQPEHVPAVPQSVARIRKAGQGKTMRYGIEEFSAPALMAFASEGVERLGIESPLLYRIEQREGRKLSRFQLRLPNFSITHHHARPLAAN